MKRQIILISALATLFLASLTAVRNADYLPPIETLAQPDKVFWKPVTKNFTDEWLEYEVYFPRNGRWNITPEMVVDGKVKELATIGGIHGGTRYMLRLRFGTDDDRRTKAVLKAQNIPFDEKLVTFVAECQFRGSGFGSFNRTESLRVLTPGAGGTTYLSPTLRKVGENINLRDYVFTPNPDYALVGFNGGEQQAEAEQQYTENLVRAGGHRLVFRCRVERWRYPDPTP